MDYGKEFAHGYEVHGYEISRQGQGRRARRVRLHRLRTGAPAAAPSARRACAAHRRPQGRAGDARGVSAIRAVQAAEARLDRKHRLEEGRARSRVLRAAACDDAEGDRRSPRQGAEDQGGRPLGRLPAARRRGLREVVRPRASRAEAPARGGLRPGRGPSRTTIKKAQARRQSGLLHELRATGADAAAQGQGDRAGRDRHRCQVRHDRGGQGGQGGDAVLRSVRRLPRLRRRPSPAHGRARPGVLGRRRPRGGGELHAASGADEPRHPVDDLCAGNPRAHRPRTFTRYF